MKHLNNQYFNLPGLMTTVQNILDESAVDPVEFLPKLSLAWDGLMVLLLLDKMLKECLYLKIVY